MKKIVLFSLPSDEVFKKISKHLFYKENTKFGYMPSDGANPKNMKYTGIWEDLCGKHNATFVYINNTDKEDREKIIDCDTLMITGGNTFRLKHNLEKYKFDSEIKKFVKKQDFVLSGFSAGAIILSPKIDSITRDWDFGADVDDIGLKDYQGLSIINYEVIPHFNEEKDSELLQKYREESNYKVKAISDEDVLVNELD